MIPVSHRHAVQSDRACRTRKQTTTSDHTLVTAPSEMANPTHIAQRATIANVRVLGRQPLGCGSATSSSERGRARPARSPRRATLDVVIWLITSRGIWWTTKACSPPLECLPEGVRRQCDRCAGRARVAQQAQDHEVVNRSLERTVVIGTSAAPRIGLAALACSRESPKESGESSSLDPGDPSSPPVST